MRRTSRRRDLYPGCRSARALALSVACVAMLAGDASGQGTTPDTGAAPRSETALEVKAAPAVAPGAQPAAPVPSQPAVVAAGGPDSPPPAIGSPRWKCNQQTVTADPVWRGQGDPTFTFQISNEGTADLRMRAGGG